MAGEEETYVAANKLSPDDLDMSFNDEEEQEDPNLELNDEDVDEQEDEDKSKDESKKDSDEDSKEDFEKDQENSEEDEEDQEDSDKKDEDDQGDEEDDGRVVDYVAQYLGLELEDSLLDEIEDNEEGIAKIVDAGAQQRFEQLMGGFMEEHPMTKKIYEYEKAGGDPEEFKKHFFPETDYNDIEINEENVAQQREIVRTSLKESGMSDSRVDRMIKNLEDSGDLYEESQDALSQLRNMQESRKEELVESQKEQQQEAVQQAQEAWQEVESMVKDQSNFAGVPLPETKKDDFLAFLSKTDEEGITPRNKKVQNMSMEEAVAVDLVLFYGFDGLEKLIKNRVTSDTTKTIKEKLRETKKSKSDGRKDREVKNADPEDIEIDFSSFDS